jgi:hypothetical protein
MESIDERHRRFQLMLSDAEFRDLELNARQARLDKSAYTRLVLFAPATLIDHLKTLAKRKTMVD